MHNVYLHVVLFDFIPFLKCLYSLVSLKDPPNRLTHLISSHTQDKHTIVQINVFLDLPSTEH